MADYQSVAPTTLALTLAEAKRHLNKSTTEDDAIITDHIKAATKFLENRTHRAFVNQTRICKIDNFYDTRYIHCRRFYPPVSPLNSSGMSLTYLDSNGASTTLPSSDYVVSTGDQPGFIAEAYNATWPSVYPQPNSVTLTYIAGHSTSAANVPTHIKQAIRMVVGHWYRNREGVLTGTISKEIELGVDALLEAEQVEGYA